MNGKGARMLRLTVGDAVPALAWLAIGAACLFAAGSMDQDGWAVAALWVLGALLVGVGGFWLWLTSTTKLSLDEAGFTYARGGRSHRREWSDVQAVIWFARQHQRFPYVEITFRTAQPDIAFLSSRRVVHVQIEGGFGLGGKKLADLMNDFRQKTQTRTDRGEG